MSLIIMKFGGTSVADLTRIRAVSKLVQAEVLQGHQVVVVVSAMAGVTNRLVKWCEELNPLYDPREYDAVLATGEQVTSGLLAIALQASGLKARSRAGWQIPLLTDTAYGKARIEKIDTKELNRALAESEISVVAGFQGISREGRISTLGRGGSDTSAIALAAALKADRCDIYTDVDGIYTTDPRIVPEARKLRQITYEEMLELASVGAKVLQTRSVEMAMKERVIVRVLSSFTRESTEEVPQGTLVVSEEDAMEKEKVTGIAYSRDEAKVTVLRIPDRPGIAAQIFGKLAEENINVDMIIQNASVDGLTDITFTVGKADLSRAEQALESIREDISFETLMTDSQVSKVSIVGVGMKSHEGVAALMFKTLAERQINILAITTSEIKVSVLIPSEYTELAVRALHAAYIPEKE